MDTTKINKGFQWESINGYKIEEVCTVKNFFETVEKMSCQPNLVFSDSYSDTFVWVSLDKILNTIDKETDCSGWSPKSDLYFPDFSHDKRISENWNIDYANSHVKHPDTYYLN